MCSLSILMSNVLVIQSFIFDHFPHFTLYSALSPLILFLPISSCLIPIVFSGHCSTLLYNSLSRNSPVMTFSICNISAIFPLIAYLLLQACFLCYCLSFIVHICILALKICSTSLNNLQPPIPSSLWTLCTLFSIDLISVHFFSTT